MDIREIQERYAEYEQLSREEAIEELVSDFPRLFLKDTSLFRSFAIDNRSAAQKLLDSFKEIFARIKSKITGKPRNMGKTLGELQEALNLWEQAMEEAKQTVKDIAEGKKEAPSQQAEGKKLSIKRINNEDVVWLENSPFTNKDLSDNSVITNYIANHIGEFYTIIESGQKVYLGDDLPGEFVYSREASALRQYQRQTWRAKAKASSGFGDLIEIASNRRWEPTKHTHNKDAKYGFYRYDSTFAFPIRDNHGAITNIKAYDLELLIRNASDGKKYLYDIVNIKENTAIQNDLMERETRSAAHAATTGSSVSKDNVAQEGNNVKRKNSISPFEDIDSDNIDMFGEHEEVVSIENQLREQLKYFQGQIKATKDATANPKAVSRIAKEIARSYGSVVDAEDLQFDLQKVYDRILRGENYPDYIADVMAISRTIAEKILETDGDLYSEYREARNVMKDTYIYVPEKLQREIPDYFDTKEQAFQPALNYSGKIISMPVCRVSALMAPVA